MEGARGDGGANWLAAKRIRFRGSRFRGSRFRGSRFRGSRFKGFRGSEVSEVSEASARGSLADKSGRTGL
jgi:uncharacterized protein YjbI with pentapeptide repeats